jgi:sulfite reductase beta subunit-like hemoprotein
MACPALPLCGLAQSEAERYLPTLMDAIEAGGHGDADVIIRMTGCPNGCARSSSSEIGLVGKGVGRYTLLTGGCYNGTRLNEQFIATVKEEDLAGILCGLLSLWKANRAEGERFGDWSKKVGVEKLQEMLDAELAAQV